MDDRRGESQGALKRQARLVKKDDSAAPRRFMLLLPRPLCLLACLACLSLLPQTAILASGQRLVDATTTAVTDMLSRTLAAGILAFSAAHPASASTLLYASSYGGSVTTLSLTSTGFDVLSSTQDCSPDPAWLTLDHENSVLYCVGEGLATRNGSLSAFKTSPTGALELLHKVDTIGGPVSSVLYGDQGRGLAVAHYAGSSVSTFLSTDLGQVQSKTWSEPLGPNTTRQGAPHPHEATVDPTGKFIMVPDLGSDLVRVLRADSSSLGFTEISPLVATAGSGPRHLVFLTADDKTFMYLVGELDNTITSYKITYNGKGRDQILEFEKVSVTNHFGDRVVPQSTAAEIHLSPDNRFLLVSSRSDRSFNIPSFDGSGKTIPSDSISSFAVDATTGALSLAQTFPAGGMIPRQFSINKAGDRVAVGLQADGRVTVIERDVQTGMLQRFVASASLEVGVTTVLFDE